MLNTTLTPLQENISFIVGTILAVGIIITLIVLLILLGLCEREEKRKTADYLQTLNDNDRIIIARYEDYKHHIKKNPFKKQKIYTNNDIKDVE